MWKRERERERGRERAHAGRIIDASSKTTVCAIVWKCLEEQKRTRAGRFIHVFSDANVSVR